jgi:uncharacterized membrane protein
MTKKQKLKKYLNWYTLIGLLIALFIFFGVGATMIVIGVIFSNGWWISAGTVYILFMIQPLIPLWIFIPLVTISVGRLLQKLSTKKTIDDCTKTDI